MRQYVALLRGINVGGKSLIKMADLKQCLEQAGLTGVSTYIASGNVFFWSAEISKEKLVVLIEAALKKTFRFDCKVVVRTQAECRAVISKAPPGFGANKDYKWNVLYLKDPVTPKQALAEVPAREGVDHVYAGPGVLYISTLLAQVTKSHLSKLVMAPVYQQMTIRNWNTASKLPLLMDAATPPSV